MIQNLNFFLRFIHISSHTIMNNNNNKRYFLKTQLKNHKEQKKNTKTKSDELAQCELFSQRVNQPVSQPTKKLRIPAS